jgi:4-hydroxybenzoate polyprenyltransferase
LDDVIVRQFRFGDKHGKLPLRVCCCIRDHALIPDFNQLVNDYYDAKLGRDAMKRKEKIILHFENGVSLNLVRELLMYMYASALLVASFLPGIPTRLAVNWALIMTYLYTKHLKPMTWIKNIVCASVISLAPWTAGSSVFHLLQNTDATMGIFFVPSLWRLFTVLFAGILGREILMDCNDVEADEAAGIRTVPVVYGRQKASRIATFSAVAMLLISSTPHIFQLMAEGLAVVPLRRLILSSIGCGAQVWGSLRVWKNKGKDPALVDKVVNGSLLTVVFLLASFI